LRKFDVLLRRLLCLLLKAMQKNHVTIAHAEDYARDPTVIEIAAHFPQAMPKRSTMWTPNWPAEFDFLDVLPYRVAVAGRQFQYPFADRIAAVWLT
jgi:hypothetical protein